jgi:hypothetical protein
VTSLKKSSKTDPFERISQRFNFGNKPKEKGLSAPSPMALDNPSSEAETLLAFVA